MKLRLRLQKLALANAVKAGTSREAGRFSRMTKCLLLMFAFSVPTLITSCSDTKGEAPSTKAISQPPEGQILRDAKGRLETQARGAFKVQEIKVERVTPDEYEQDLCEAVVSYKARGFVGKLGLSYKRADGFWKLERTVDLGLK